MKTKSCKQIRKGCQTERTSERIEVQNKSILTMRTPQSQLSGFIHSSIKYGASTVYQEGAIRNNKKSNHHHNNKKYIIIITHCLITTGKAF